MSSGARTLNKAILACLIAVFAAPVFVLAAALLTRTGLISPETGYDLLARRLGFWLAVLCLVIGGVSLGMAIRARRGWVMSLGALAVAVTVLVGFVWQNGRVERTPGEDVSTDLEEIPGFGVMATDRRGSGPAGTIGVAACPGALPAMTQSVPESVVYELQQLGFSVRRAGVTGVYGSRQGFWFGFTEDVAVRIRPGRTDIRVAARDDRPHGGRACDAVTRISQALKVGEG